MRRDIERFRDMLDALDSITKAIDGRTEAEFVNDEILRDAVVRRLIVVGEAAAQVSMEIRRAHTGVPWANVVAFRNILVHEYFGIHWPIVWVTAIERVPVLRNQIQEVLRSSE
jgi:uncharacterized protein with HEPN domain